MENIHKKIFENFVNPDGLYGCFNGNHVNYYNNKSINNQRTYLEIYPDEKFLLFDNYIIKTNFTNEFINGLETEKHSDKYGFKYFSEFRKIIEIDFNKLCSILEYHRQQTINYTEYSIDYYLNNPFNIKFNPNINVTNAKLINYINVFPIIINRYILNNNETIMNLIKNNKMSIDDKYRLIEKLFGIQKLKNEYKEFYINNYLYLTIYEFIKDDFYYNSQNKSIIIYDERIYYDYIDILDNTNKINVTIDNSIIHTVKYKIENKYGRKFITKNYKFIYE